MASVILQKFAGLVPRMSPRLLANGEATRSVTTKLWSGEIRPIKDLGEVLNVNFPPLSGGEILTVYLLLDKWLAWTKDVNVVTGFTTLSGPGHIYWTGDGPPKQALYADLRFGPATPPDSLTYPVGIVGPTDAPTISGSTDGPNDPVTYSYVYTFYNLLNEESVPSPPSALVTVHSGAGQSVTLTGFDLPPPNCDEIRLYRTIGGTFIFVASIFAPTTSYTDSATDLDLAGNESLQSQEYYPPPPDIQGLIGLACGSLAAFHNNGVVFSEPYQPGAWPPAYEKIFDYPVVALGTFGQTCVVATTGYTYLISGNDPRNFAVARIPDPYPCVSKRSMVSADNGVVYASADGLIFVGTPSYSSAWSGVFVLTRELMTHDEWQAYHPDTINGVIFDGRYYGFYLNYRIDDEPVGAGFIMDFSNRLNTIVTGVVEDGGESDKRDILTDLDMFPSALFANPQVSLHMVILNRLYKWEAGIPYRTWIWRSKLFSFPYAVTFSVGKIIFNQAFPLQAIFRMLDGQTGALLYERTVTSATPFRLPSILGRVEWMFEVEGTAGIQMVQVSSSYADLTDRKAA